MNRRKTITVIERQIDCQNVLPSHFGFLGYDFAPKVPTKKDSFEAKTSVGKCFVKTVKVEKTSWSAGPKVCQRTQREGKNKLK